MKILLFMEAVSKIYLKITRQTTHATKYQIINQR